MAPWLLPSPLAKLLSRHLAVGTTKLAPADLLDPSKVAAIPPKLRSQVVARALKRILDNSVHMAALRQQPLGAAFSLRKADTLQGLSVDTQKTLCTASRSLPLGKLAVATWGEILTRPRRPARAQLVVALAEVEFVNTQARHQANHQAVCEWIDELLADPRLEQIREDDLRYSWCHLQRTGSLADLLTTVRARDPSVGETLYLEKLRRGFRCSLAEDIEDIGAELASRALAQPTARLRAVEIFAARFGARAVSPKLHELGKNHGVTSKRIGQVVHRLLDQRGDASLASPAALALLHEMAQFQYLSIPLLEEKLGLGPGSGGSLQIFRRFVRSVLRPVPPLESIHPVFTQRGDVMNEERAGVSSTIATAPKHLTLIRLAQRQFRVAGAANVTHLAGALTLLGQTVMRGDMDRLIGELPKAQWIDRERGWFILDDLANSLVYHRVRKMFAVAQVALTVREIGEALYRDARLAEETEGEFALAPLKILRLAMLTWLGIVEERPGFLADRSGTTPAEVLAENELKVYEVLAERGGVAPTDAVVRAAARDNGNAASIRAALAQMVFAHSPVRGVTALRGWPMNRSDWLAVLAESSAAGKADSPERPTVVLIQRH